MADWLKKPWIEKAICSFYEKDAAQPKFARAQIIQFNKIPCEKSAYAEALLSDKWMYAKAIFTPQAIEEFEKSPSNICEFSLCDIKGGLIFLNDYKVVPHVDYAKGVWEHLLIVNKFTFKGSEKTSQFGSELINSAAHSPFQVRIKKHFQLKQLAQLLHKDKDTRKLKLEDNKAFDVKAITDSIVERHQFVFIPDEQQQLLDNIPEWRSDFCPSSTVDSSNQSLNTSLPSSQQVQNDVSMSPKSNQSNDQNDKHQPSTSGINTESNDWDFSLKEPPPNDGILGSTNSCENDGTYNKIPDPSSLSLETVQRSQDSACVSGALEQHLEQSSKSGVPSCSKGCVSLGTENKTKGKGKKERDKRLNNTDMNINTNQSLYVGYMVSERNSVSMVPEQLEENSASELTVEPTSSCYRTLLDILENLENQSDPFVCNSKTGKRDSVGGVVEENEEVEDWSKATNKDKQVRRSSIELVLARQRQMRDDWLDRCSCAEASFQESSLSGENLASKEKENDEEIGSRTKKEDSFQRGNSTKSSLSGENLDSKEKESDEESGSRTKKEDSFQRGNSTKSSLSGENLDSKEKKNDEESVSRTKKEDSFQRGNSTKSSLSAENLDSKEKENDEEISSRTKKDDSFQRGNSTKSSLSAENLENKEKESDEESVSRTKKEDSFQRNNSIINENAEFSRLLLESTQSQYLEEGRSDTSGGKCIENFTVGDQTEIVLEDATDDTKKRSLKKVVSICKETCHSAVTEDGNKATETNRYGKQEDKTSGKVSGELEYHEHKNHSERFSSGSGVIPKSDEMKGLGAHGDGNILNSQHALTSEVSLALKENNSSQLNYSILGTDGDVSGGILNRELQFVLEEESRGVYVQARTYQGWEQEQDESIKNNWDKNVKDCKNMKEESISVASAGVAQSQIKTEKNQKGWKKGESSSRIMTSSVPVEIVEQTKGQDLSKKSIEKYNDCNLGELSTTGAVDKESSSSSVASLIPNSISDGSSSSEQKSDESFSILKNTSISDLTPGGFKPAFTSTARQTSPSANQNPTLKAKETRKDRPRKEGNLSASKKHVTFGKSIFYTDKLDFKESLEPTTSQNIVSSLHDKDPSDDDSILPCTQQEDDSQLVTFQDPLQILRTMSSSATKKFQKDPKLKALCCQATNGAGVSAHRDAVEFVDNGDVPKHSRSDCNSEAMQRLVGDVLQSVENNALQRSPKKDAMRRRGLACCDSDALRQQILEDAQGFTDDDDAPDDDDGNSQASFIIGVDNEIVLCSDESEEFPRSPKAVAKESVLQCIKQSSNKVYDDLVMGSDDSPSNIISTSPKTAAEQNILRCIKQDSKNDSRADVTKALSQSKQSSALPLKAGPEKENTDIKGQKSLQLTLTDSELVKALNSSAEKENTSSLGSRKKNKNILKKGKSPQEVKRATSTTPVTKTSTSSISTSTFYETSNNDYKEQPRESVVSLTGSDVNVTSLPENIDEGVACLMYVPGKGLETSSVHVTLNSHQQTKVTSRNTGSEKMANNSRNTEHLSQKQTRRRLSMEKKNTQKEQEKNRTVEKRKERPRDCISNATIPMDIHKNTTQPTNLEKSDCIPDQLDIKGTRDDRTVAMETDILRTSAISSDVANLVRGEGRLKRKRSQDDETRAAKKITITEPSTITAQVSTSSLNTTKNKDKNEGVLNVCASSQAFTEYSCEHMLYSQQDPLVLEFSSSENSDFSQESKINDYLSSPLLLPSPPRETKTVPQSTAAEASNLILEKSEKVMEDSFMSADQEASSPKFVSLPSYQVPTTKTNNYLRPVNKQKDTTLQHTSTSRGKTKPIIISDSEDEEIENSFCWFAPW